MAGPEFPPLLTGRAVAGDPFGVACEAAEDADPGTVFYSPDETTFRVAILLAPEAPLGEAISVSFAAQLGLNDALGALSPPEVAVHLVWPDRIRVNGGLCGRMRVAASTEDPAAEPDWLVIGLEVPLLPSGADEPGQTPNETCLHEEGCGTVTAGDLVETWARHMMNWLHIYMTDGFGDLHEEWRSKAHALGEEITYPETGQFVGLDEWAGMILKDGSTTRILPLTRVLDP